MTIHESSPRALGDADLEHFIDRGYVRIDHAFPRALADEAREILWRDTGCDPDDPATWTRPVVRLAHYSQPPFVAAANTATPANITCPARARIGLAAR